MPFRSHHALAAACVATLASSAFAQTATSAPAEPTTTVTLTGLANYAFDTDLHDSGGSFSVFRSGGSVGVDHHLSQQTDLRLTFGGEYSHYFFRNIAAVPGDDGSDALDAYQFDLRPTFMHYCTENFSVYGGLTITASGMADADFGDSLAYGAFAGFNYKVSPSFWVGAGIGFTTQLEDNAFVVPLISANWQIDKQWLLSSDGLGVKLSYKVDDAWTVYARAHYDYRQFRLDDNEIISGGVLTDQAVPVTIGATYELADRLKLTAEAGVIAYRRLEFRSSGGDQVGADEADPAGFLSVQLEYSF